ncbi:hypothetical protein L210DRAFT_2290236 [Boletus edulis BED1]|uniref:Major facilitator superfamily (MFS) profile domain-containing protein n=1 Tax=Boletus edulis BED1 TaxID=1328754 RepID=A0AAD4BC97_BOLED|nr:hypothetical protein L210DRAFT_2290236 [Boletus edulis BED1]
MATKESPLLGDQLHPSNATNSALLPIEDIYDRFSRKEKRVILAIVSLTALVPSVSCISFDFFCVFRDRRSFISVRWWLLHPVDTTNLQRPQCHACRCEMADARYTPFPIIGSFATAVSPDLNSLLFWRFVQTFGGAGSYALGAATIGDIYKVEERGTAMGTFAGAMLIGLAMAPPIGGAFAEYLYICNQRVAYNPKSRYIH